MLSQFPDDQPEYNWQCVDSGTGLRARRRAKRDRHVSVISAYVLLLASGMFSQPANANDILSIGIVSAQVEYAEAHCGMNSIGRFKSMVAMAKRGDRVRFNEGRKAQWNQLVEQQKLVGVDVMCKELLASPLSTFLKEDR